MSQTAHDLLDLLRDDARSPELRRMAMNLIGPGCGDSLGGC